MFGGAFSTTHIIIVLAIVLIIFGPGKLPQVGKALGTAISDMRSSMRSEKAPAEAEKDEE